MAITRNIPKELKRNDIDLDYCDAFRLICTNMSVCFPFDRFVYFIDESFVFDSSKAKRIDNLTPDYEKILNNGLLDLKYKNTENKFCEDYNHVIDSMIILVHRIIVELEKIDPDNKKITWFKRLIDGKPTSFEEAIQRMLFLNQLLWQTDHRLVGLGAWDRILYKYYQYDISNGIINENDGYDIIRDLFVVLHNNYDYKSSLLKGDTGQIFVLGYSDDCGNYICNSLTYIFIEVMKDLHLPEPKCLLRVNKNTPRSLIDLSLQSIATGIGAPLFANDDVIIPSLRNYGVQETDLYYYGTSACWEPLICGKSTSLNNILPFNYLMGLDFLLRREKIADINDFDIFYTKYIFNLKQYIKSIKRNMDRIRLQYDPLLSVFIGGCFENKKDVSYGGAKYHDFGITTVAMGNLIDSLLNIKEYVFDTKRLTLLDVKKIMLNNYEGFDSIKSELKEKKSRYGVDDDEVVELVNSITEVVAEEFKKFKTYIGGNIKIGLSGSAYLDSGKLFGASFDGRGANEPFTVHISNERNNGYTEVINFASQLKYDNGRINGNVVDLMVAPGFVETHKDKFLDFIMECIGTGFFEMQMNVVSSEVLIRAKEKPEDYQNLIVRVWGFSAYFNELPEEYKNVLIQRALANERNSA